MVWGCFGGGKSGELVEVKGTLQKNQYHAILQRHTILSGTIKNHWEDVHSAAGQGTETHVKVLPKLCL